MKPAPRAYFILLLVVGIAVAAAEIDRSRYVDPTPETQSTFFRTYTPALAVDRFKEKQNSFSSQSAQAVGGREFATHRTDSKQYFVISAQNEAALEAAVRDELFEKLSQSGDRITEQGSSAAGVEIRYEVGQTRGAVAIHDLQAVDPTTIVGAARLCPNQKAVMLRVEIAETWSKLESGSRRDRPTLAKH